MKTRCIFCGSNFSDIDTLENHLRGHKGLNTFDRNTYLKEVKQEIQKHEEADKRKEQTNLNRELFKEYKTNMVELLTSQKVDKEYLDKVTNCKSITQIKKIVTNNLVSYHDFLNEKEIDFYYAKKRKKHKTRKKNIIEKPKSSRTPCYDSTISSIRPILIAAGNKR